MNQKALAFRSVFRALRLQVLAPAIDITVDEVVDHFNVVLDVEFPHGSLAQVIRYCSNTVALLDGETRDRQIGTVLADKCDVRAMQSRDERQLPLLSSRSQHLPGK